jgi:hypothetical protein
MSDAFVGFLLILKNAWPKLQNLSFYFNLSPQSAVTTAAPHHRCTYCHTYKAQCNQCDSDFTVGILKVLLTITTGVIDSLTYTIQPYAH